MSGCSLEDSVPGSPTAVRAVPAGLTLRATRISSYAR